MEALERFRQVAELAGMPLQPDDIQVEFLPAPHRAPSSLPREKMAVYAFWSEGVWLKVGHAGPNSNARYTSQHYSPSSAGSTLARSLCSCSELAEKHSIESTNVGSWIKTNCCRANILLPSHKPHEIRWLLEAFLHARLRPRFER